MWNPWVGSRYCPRRLLLLGESHHDWVNKDSGIFHRPEADAPCMVVGESREAPLKGAPTMIKLTRALCDSEALTPEQASEAWDTVAFTNYVPVSVGFGPHPAPNSAAWKQAEQEWPGVLELLKPRVVIVLGLRMWNKMPETQTVMSDLVQGYRLANGETAMCYAVRHPVRGGPGWEWYSAFIARNAEGAM